MARPWTWKRIAAWSAITVAILGILGVASAAIWFARNGRDFLWAQIRPGDAELLRGESIPESLSAEEWAEDVAFLARELPQRFVRFDEAVDRGRFEADAEHLLARMAGLDRPARLLGVMDLAALPSRPGRGAGHTGVSPLQRPIDWRIYPFYVYLFDDGPWITVGTGDAARAVGARIVSIGGRPVEDVLAAARPYVSADNESGLRHKVASTLSFAGFLQGLGVAESDGTAVLELRRDAGESFTLRVEPVALASLGGLRLGRTLSEPVDTWSPADPRPRERNYWFEHREDQRLVYVQLNAVRNQPDGETIAEFTERLGEFVEGQDFDTFVLDLRANGGGDNQLVGPLVDLIAGHPRIERRGVLYTLIGRRTFSAAGNLTAQLERRTRTLFAGEASGFTPNHHGDAVDVVLPRSKVLVDISTRYWEDGGPYDRRPAIEPDLPVPFEHRHHFENRDPVLEAVLAHRAGTGEAAGRSEQIAVQARAALEGRYAFSPFMTLTIGPDGPEGLSLTITGVDPWALSRLYSIDGRPGLFGTDLRDVRLERDPDSGVLSLDWRGTSVVLRRLPEEYALPIDLIRRGAEMPGDPGALRRGIEAYRELAGEGAVPDSHTEFALNRIGYDLLRQDRVEAAVELFRLQTALFPHSANVFDSLGDALRRSGSPQAAADAFRRALWIDPGFDHSRRMLEEIGGK